MTSRAESYAAHVRRQRRAWLALTHAQRLAWLWQVKLFAERARRAAKLRRRQAVAASSQSPEAEEGEPASGGRAGSSRSGSEIGSS